MKWPLVSRKFVEELVQENARLRDEVCTLRSEQAQQDRRDTLIRQANEDRDAWAAKVEEMESRVDAMVNAGVDAAVKRIEAQFESAKTPPPGQPS